MFHHCSSVISKGQTMKYIHQQSETALMLSPNEYKQYNPFFHLTDKKASIYQRYNRAFQIAKAVATYLRTNYHVDKVYIFGFLSDINDFNEWSDIDLSVTGISSHLFYKAVADVTHFDQEFEIDLIDINDCKKEMKATIESFGIEI